MARGEKLLTLDFEFSFSLNGETAKEFAVKLRAPGLDQFRVHNRMAGLVAKCQVGLTQAFANLQRPENAPAPDDDKPETDQEAADRILQTLSMGLGPDAFADEMEWVKRTLTKNPKLASVGDTGVPLNDLVWESIGNEGGISAVNLVIAHFVGFFLDSPAKSPSGTGSAKQLTSPSGTAVH